MTDNDPNVTLLAQELKAFLEEAGWQEGHRARGAVFYMAPKSLGIEGNYAVALPQDALAPGAATLLHGASNALVDVYGYGSVGDLLNRAAAVGVQTMPTYIATRFVDPATRYGAIALGELVDFLTNLEHGLYRCARFKMGDDSDEGRSIARRFARECRFLQTAQDSFVAKVEVPITVLKQADSLGGRALSSTEICSSFFSAIHFLNQSILENDDAFDAPDTLSSTMALFDAGLLESVTKLVTGHQMERIDFSMEMGTVLRTSTTGYISHKKRRRARDFLQFASKWLLDTNNPERPGHIVELS